MGEEKTYIEAVTLTEPEKLSANRLSQYSVSTRAMEFHSLISRYDKIKGSLSETGLQFGGRVLLVGSPGTDFEAFAHHLSREVPLKLVRFRMESILGSTGNRAEILRVGFEFTKRNSPALLYIDRLENVCPAQSETSAVLIDEMKGVAWDQEEVLVVASTTKPKIIDSDLLSIFDRVYVFEGTSIDDRIRLFEQTMKGREDIDPSVIAELTDGWGFASLKQLASSLFMMDKKEGGQIPKEMIEEMIEKSGVMPLSSPHYLDSVAGRIGGKSQTELKTLNDQYPDDFLDQLYLMAVGENFSSTQRVIEVLNEGMPLSKEDRDTLTRYPFLLTGTPEDRLTRLLRAKKSSDRLQRIMGR